ncbi:MAG: Dabb family protein [Pseudomonadales bacterium]|nr:Dabb family protein [Pseudomonadales bacterium]
MIKHIVLLKWNKVLNAEELKRLNSGFSALAEKIEEIQSYQYGPDLNFYRGNADYALIAEFVDQAALDRYVKHDLHQRFLSELAGPLLASFMSVQVES